MLALCADMIKPEANMDRRWHEQADMNWPTCGHKGCYAPVAVNRESTRQYGARPVPLTFHVHGEAVQCCASHANWLRYWLSLSNDERNEQDWNS